MKILNVIITGLLLTVAGRVYSQDFVYTPKNPAFGGNPYNYGWLLSSAQAQNKIKEATSPLNNSTSDPLKDFASSLNRQILSQLSRQIVSKQFGEDALASGTYVIGDYQIEIGDQSDGINITILDNKSGSQTTVSVPFF